MQNAGQLDLPTVLHWAHLQIELFGLGSHTHDRFGCRPVDPTPANVLTAEGTITKPQSLVRSRTLEVVVDDLDADMVVGENGRRPPDIDPGEGRLSLGQWQLDEALEHDAVAPTSCDRRIGSPLR